VLALAALALVLVLLDYAADPWWTIVLILSALVGCALAIVWFAGCARAESGGSGCSLHPPRTLANPGLAPSRDHRE